MSERKRRTDEIWVKLSAGGLGGCSGWLDEMEESLWGLASEWEDQFDSKNKDKYFFLTDYH